MARSKVVPESKKALDILKYEIAAELGLPVGNHMSSLNADTEFASELGSIQAAPMRKESWGHITSRDNGAVGGRITQRLIQRAEETLFTL
ncbi:alpha/beta-type small acid-soluble spore protein [Paenibacillus qinlingensis]|uniref:Small acid-soluble spore protein alpha-beta type n=1 Tax=Paenibacillus qinlingensis TaxID=1837343 RepID=A0ABU1P1J8_9BACL|nr:alpha/beta-type small acid-soluble spore protein [Paenibacillus qinlingensis]MDR6553621.1 hypothetical protein [Paenibacillus qinlingensis]